MNAIDFITRGVVFDGGKILGDDADTATLNLLRDEVERRKALIRSKQHHRTGCRHCGEPWPTAPACPLCARAVAKVAEEDRRAWTLGAPEKVKPRARRGAVQPSVCAHGHVLVDGACSTCAQNERAMAAIREMGRELREKHGPGRFTWLVARPCACGSDMLKDGFCVQCGTPDQEAKVESATIDAWKDPRQFNVTQSTMYACKPCGKSTLHKGEALTLHCVECKSKTWVCRHCGNRIDADPCVWCWDGNGGINRKVL